MHNKELTESFSWAGKLFFSGVLSYVGGSNCIPNIPIKLKLTQEQKEVIRNVIKTSREFHDELKKPNSKIETVMEKLNQRNKSKKEFEKVFNLPWPL